MNKVQKWHFTCLLFAFILLSGSICQAKKKIKNQQSSMYVLVSDYIQTDGKADVADALQKLIDENPNRTIFFPDGVYMLSHSLLTPADPSKAVHLVFANFATLKAAENWQGGALVRLGGKFPFNTIYTNGSNYGIEGGIFDGSKVADGITIESGRETRVCHASIKHTQVGIHILHGANSGSSDSDIVDVNIVGNGDSKSIGVLIEGFDNTLTNMRIANINTGIWCKSGGNSMKNIHPLTGADYPNSCGFRIEGSNNWFDYCYSDHFGIGFQLGRGAYNHFTFCWVWWYSDKVPFEIGIQCDGPLESYFEGLRTGFSPKVENAILLKAEKGGHGWIESTKMPSRQFAPEDVSAEYSR